MAHVYRHIRLDKNIPFYVGIGKDDNFYRAHSTANRNRHWYNIVSVTKYEVEILFENISYESAKEKEKYFISIYGRRDNKTGCLVNLTDGGEGSKNMSNEHRQKIIDCNTGIIFTKERKDKIRVKAIGRILKAETRIKMSEVHSNINKSWLKKFSKGIDNPRSFKVSQYTLDGDFVKTWDFANEAIKSLNLNRTCITDCLKGRQKTAGGFVWKKQSEII